MKFKGNVDVDKRTIDLNLSIQKEEGEEDFFDGLFGGSKNLIETVVDEEDELDDVEEEVE